MMLQVDIFSQELTVKIFSGQNPLINHIRYSEIVKVFIKHLAAIDMSSKPIIRYLAWQKV